MNARTFNGARILNCSDEVYFGLPEVSNSDINWLKEQTSSRDSIGDKQAAYRFGTLLDAVVTDQDRIDFFKKTIDGTPVIPQEWDKAIRMRKSFFADKFCLEIYTDSEPQVVMTRDVELDFYGLKYSLPMRGKWDFFLFNGGYGSDLKSTTATTQEQFEASVAHFGYDQQMAVYMEIAQIDFVVLLGVSKVNYRVFKKFIRRGDETWESGMNKLRYWGYKYFTLFY